MKQKTTWMRYLIIGVISCFCTTLISCGTEEVDYVFNADIIFKNKTNYPIRYYQFFPDTKQKVFIFELLPKAEYKKEVRGSGGTKEPLEASDYKGVFESFQGSGGILIEYENNKCLTYTSGKGPTTENFTHAFDTKKISDRHYEFTYHFTEEEYNQAEDCN